MNQPIDKEERHILEFEETIDQGLATALGRMVVAYGRLEDVFKVAIKRLEVPQRSLKEVVQEFSGNKGNLGKLLEHSEQFQKLRDCCSEGKTLNTKRQDYLHATFGVEKGGGYVRFRRLVGYTDLEQDIRAINDITARVYSLIREIDKATGSPLTESSNTPVAVSAAGNIK